MSYGMKRVERIVIGEKVTTRSAENVAQAYIQGVEINQIGLLRSGLPILGRNPRYKLVDNSITGSISDNDYFLDTESASDAGLGQDTTVVNGITVANVKFPDGKITETISFAVNTTDYGYGKEYIDSVPYFDLQKFEILKYMENDGPTGMFPIVGSYISYDEKLSFNGIVEPFEIRRRALGLNIFLENERQPGSIVAGHSDPPLHSYDSRENDLRAEFFEDTGTKGLLPWTSRILSPEEAVSHAETLLSAEFVSNYNKEEYPFHEMDNADLLISDSEIESIQLSMDPTLDEGIFPVTHVDMTVGFDAQSRDRINSIVFRGMTRR